MAKASFVLLAVLTFATASCGQTSGSSPTAAPSPTPQQASGLKAVTCLPSSRSCWAVGGEPSQGEMIETYDGSGWGDVAVPPTNRSALTSVACAQASLCWAVAADAQLDRWDGQAWSWVPAATAGLPTGSQLTGVACATTSVCWAVGFVGAPGSSRTLIARGEGTAWVVLPSPNAGPSSFLRGIACPTTTLCWAVGGDSSIGTIVEKFDGTSWSVASSPSSPQPNYLLDGVACGGTVMCVAVGEIVGQSSPRTFVEQWDGRTWTEAQAPGRAGNNNELSGVACAGSQLCWAVGTTYPEGGGSNATLVERYDGRRWTIAGPVGTGSLNGVGCLDAAHCWAVDDFHHTPLSLS